MKKLVILCCMCMLVLLSPTLTAFAGEGTGVDEIVRIEEDAQKDIVSTLYVADDVVLPLRMDLKGAGNVLSVVIDHGGQAYVIEPGRYRIMRAIDGNGERLSSGATLNIMKYDSQYYLDFNKPDEALEIGMNWKGFILINIVFLVVAYIAAKLFKKYRKSIVG